MSIKEVAAILTRAEEIREEINVNAEDISNEFLALANGFKSVGGRVYILQTLNLRSIRFEDRMSTYEFLSWAMTVTE